ncbi:MAG: putative selenium-dependent hydroxylase accessory protein YqeC [Treponema sp.]|nr:putative selenium-dependent hydroxylase accessory protein YqeC [Treponema sp.]
MESLSAWFENEIFGPSGIGAAGGARKGPEAGVPGTGYPGGGFPPVIAFVGSGGKTSLIWHLARRLSRRPGETAAEGRRPAKRALRRVLVTPSTKMRRPPPEAGAVRTDFSGGAGREGTRLEALPGITFAGSFNEKTGKVESLPPGELERLAAGYDLVLVESDGSRELPLKGWADYEPVVPARAALTLGILPLGVLGMPADERIIFRLPEFCALSGVLPGETLKAEHLVKVISGNPAGGAQLKPENRGLFAAARGERILFLNQAEDEAAFAEAGEIVSLLPALFRPGLRRVIAGSVRQDTVMVL